jgi:predicted DNA-binding transcriptional regulator AlpA
MFKDELLNFTDLMKKTGMSRSTLARRIKDGSLTPVKFGNTKLYSYRVAINVKHRKKCP